MSKGMILGAMGQALGNTGAQISGMMQQDNAREEQYALRSAERDEQRRWQAEQNELYKKPVDMLTAGKAGSGPAGVRLDQLSGDGAASPLVAGMAGMTAPEMAAYEEAQRTGDFSKFKTANADGYGSAGPEQFEPKKDYPKGVSEESIRAKFAMLANLKTGLMMGKDNESYQDGERQRQAIDATKQAEADPSKSPIIAQAMAAGKGDGAYGRGNVNQFNGTPDQIGKSVITENLAQAGKANADAKNSGSDIKSETLKALTQERIAATNAASDARREYSALAAQDMPALESKAKLQRDAMAEAKAKLKRYEDARDAISDRLRDFTSNGGSTPKAEAKASPPAGTTKGGSKYTLIK